jgi:hypothetical protein
MGRKHKYYEIDDLYSHVSLTEPLQRFKDNVEAMLVMLGETKKTISRRVKQVERLSENWEDTGGMIKAWSHLTSKSLPELRQTSGEAKEFWLKVNEHELESLRKDYQELYTEYQKQNNEFAKGLPDFQEYFSNALPMYFVYLMTIWDAFIVDTIKNIILNKKLVNFQEKNDQKTNVSQNYSNIDVTTDELVEEKIHKLLEKRKSFAAVFKYEWGIDWQESGVGLPFINELRACRNIWVHNQGKVDKKYLETLKKENYNTLKMAGEIASIDMEYIKRATLALTILAIYIHSKATTI